NYHINIFNDGTGTGDVYMYTDGFNGTGGICASTNLVVEADSGSGWFEKYNGPIMDTEGEANKFSLKVEPLAPGGTLEVRQRVELDVEAPNTAQGQTCEWNEVFILEQA